MLIVRAPFRISFFGGGTDYYEYFSKYGGSVISTTIDKYCYVSMRDLPPIFSYRNQLTYSKIEHFNSPDELSHPLVKAALRYIPYDGIQISYDADLPACSGIGSSSAFAVALVQGLRAMNGEYPDKMEIAKQAIHLERNMCCEAGGVQDQLASAFGGLNRYYFDADGYRVEPLRLRPVRIKELKKNLLLMFTGFTHLSGEVAKAQQANIPATLSYLDEMKSIVDEAQDIFLHGDLDEIGYLLDRSWSLKKQLSGNITTDEIDRIYLRAKQSGALGGKILGAGGGGYMLLYVPENEQAKVKGSLSDYTFVNFDFEKSGTILMYENEVI